MNHFVNGTQFSVLACAKCGLEFAITADYERRRREDHKEFYCPAGHSNFYNGKTEAQKLREQLEREEANVHQLRQERDSITKAHRRMRQRVVNGVCPCYNRSFPNLRDHMATKHADFGKEKTLRALRES